MTASIVAVLIAGVLSLPDKPATSRAGSRPHQGAAGEGFALIKRKRWEHGPVGEKRSRDETNLGAVTAAGRQVSLRNKDVRPGSMEIVESIIRGKIASKSTSSKKFEAHNAVVFTWSRRRHDERVWAMEVPVPYFGRSSRVYRHPDSMVGKDFEAGMANEAR